VLIDDKERFAARRWDTRVSRGMSWCVIECVWEMDRDSEAWLRLDRFVGEVDMTRAVYCAFMATRWYVIDRDVSFSAGCRFREVFDVLRCFGWWWRRGWIKACSPTVTLHKADQLGTSLCFILQENLEQYHDHLHWKFLDTTINIIIHAES
jgi:hypothetical protein